jgi:hypothetical protein
MSPEDPSKKKGTRKALVISISQYDNPGLQPLEFCRNDGEEMYDLLKSLEYEISNNHKVIGSVKYDIMRDAIYDFFDNPDIRAEDTLLFYFSGHGMPATDGDMYLASSEINPDAPYKRGFSAYELTKMVQRSVSIRIITILDCCYSGSARISKGHEDDAAKLGTQALENNKKILHQGEGKCLLAASQATQEAYGLKEKGHSIFTHYLLQGLRGNVDSVDIHGNITPYSLGNYVYKEILNLPQRKRPKQKPITKVEASGDIILAQYPELADRTKASTIVLPSPGVISELKENIGKLWKLKSVRYFIVGIYLLFLFPQIAANISALIGRGIDGIFQGLNIITAGYIILGVFLFRNLRKH